MKRGILPFGFVMVIAIAVNSGIARDLIEVESRYSGNGCFQYYVRTLEDPFVNEVGLAQLIPYPFTNYISAVVPAHWTNSFSQGEWNGIAFDASGWPPRINEVSFSVCSSSTNFSRHVMTTGFAVVLADCFRFRYISGYANLPCLVPCSQEEADGSPPQMVARFELLPDLVINQLILTNGEVHGLTFSGTSVETVELQGSHDLTNWTAITRFEGAAPGTWTTNASLNAYGEFFRLRAVPVTY